MIVQEEASPTAIASPIFLHIPGKLSNDHPTNTSGEMSKAHLENQEKPLQFQVFFPEKISKDRGWGAAGRNRCLSLHKICFKGIKGSCACGEQVGKGSEEGMLMVLQIGEHQKRSGEGEDRTAWGESGVSDIRRSDHKHKGIYIQIFKHS